MEEERLGVGGVGGRRRWGEGGVGGGEVGGGPGESLYLTLHRQSNDSA